MKLTIAFICAFAVGFVSSSPFERIIEGENASELSAPYMVSFQSPHEINGTLVNAHFCGGAILNEQWILTAAHCFIYKDMPEIIAAVGFTDLEENVKGYHLDKVIMHEEYDHHYIVHDIALVKIKEHFTFSEKVQPAVLGTYFVKGGAKLRLTGWGITVNSGPGSNLPSRLLQEMETTSCTHEECQDAHYKTIHETQLCTMAKKGTGSCKGDSGGPLVLGKNTLVGIVSWGEQPCGDGYFPDVFTRVTSYLDWIEKHMSQN